MEWQGRAAIVTGAASGIGAATAAEFVRRGVTVGLFDIDGDKGRAQMDRFRVEGGQALFFRVDVADVAACRAAVAEFCDQVGRLDYLVNNAASFLSKGMDATTEEWDHSLAVNVRGYAQMAAACFAPMKAARGGAIVNIASISGHIAQPNRWTYNACKGAVLSMTRCMALDMAPAGVRVNSVSPGWTWTPEVAKAAIGGRERWEPSWGRFSMLRRLAEAEEIARPHPVPLQRRRQLHHRRRPAGGRRLSRARNRAGRERFGVRGKPVTQVEQDIYAVRTKAAGPIGELPLTAEMLLERPSGDIFALSQNAGMGWNPRNLNRRESLILSTQGGIRRPDGTPVALGYHTGHWEVGLLMEAAAEEFGRLGCLPFAGYCSDPCDGRSQGTTGMMDSLPYRNDAAIVFRRLIRSLPNRRGVLGVATCDKGLPAMMMALAAMRHLPCVLVPGGVTLPAEHGEDAGKIQSVGARFAHGQITLKEAAELGCRACATPGGGCQFFGTAATAQVVGEALGLSVPHSALSPSGQPIWLDMARRSARALAELDSRGVTTGDILTDSAIHNAMAVHAACGGSTNLLLHVPAIAHAAGLRRPTVEDWHAVNVSVPRLVDVLPNGPTDHPTVRLFLAGGVPEVMLHLRERGLLRLDALTVTGKTLGENLEEWAASERRVRLRERLREQDGVDPDDVILAPDRATARGLTSTVTFPRGNLCPEGSVIKSTSIDPSVVDPDGVYRKIGPARVFTSERAAIAAIKAAHQDAVPHAKTQSREEAQREEKPRATSHKPQTTSHEPQATSHKPRTTSIQPGDILVLICRGPMGAGMEEIYQITSALKFLPWGKQVAVVTDARFSGVSTGACIGHVGPEALAGGPVGKVLDGDLVEIVVDRVRLEGSVNLIGHGETMWGAEEGSRELERRSSRPDLSPDPDLPDDTRLWAALQAAGGGTWGGCVYDVDAIVSWLSSRRYVNPPICGGGGSSVLYNSGTPRAGLDE